MLFLTMVVSVFSNGWGKIFARMSLYGSNYYDMDSIIKEKQEIFLL